MNPPYNKNKCVICGTEGKMQYQSPPICSSSCFTKNFWQEKIDWDNDKDPNAVRIRGRHYYIGEEPSPNTPSHCYGFGGRKHVVKFNDGRIVTTHNLWCQGGIPEEFKAQLPDNAVFLDINNGKEII